MAQTSCGMHWSWDSPMWCSGKELPDKKKKKYVEDNVEPMCARCPWWKGHKNIELC